MTHAPSKKSGAGQVIPPPDGGWGWMVVFGSFMIHIIADGITYTMGIFVVEFKDYYDAGAEATSWIVSILVGVTLGSGPITSALVNKYGCREVTMAGAVVAAVGLGVSIVAPQVSTLYITIGLLTGFGFGLIYLPAIVSVTCYFEKKRSFATGIAVCGSGIGTFIFAPLSETLIKTFHWKGAMLILTGITLNCVVFGALFRPLEPKSKKADPQSAIEMVEKEKLIQPVPATTETAPAVASIENDSLQKGTNLEVAVNGTESQKVVEENKKNLLAVRNDSTNAAIMFRSQPHLLQVPSVPQYATQRKFGSHGNLLKSKPEIQQRGSRKNSTNEATGSGVMYRKDILYSGSVHNLPEYKADPQGYTGSISRIPEAMPEETTPKILGCIPCSKEAYDAFKEMMDLSIMVDPIFILFSVSNFCTSIGFYVPYVYMKDMALEMNIPEDQASFSIALIGIANTISRIILGYISDKSWLNRLWLYNSALTICGIATAFCAVCQDYISLAVCVCLFGFTIGAYVGLTSVILVDLIGLAKLTNAFGILLLFQGIASLIGPPIAGRLRDSLNSYNPGFYVAGTMIAISGIMLFFIPCIQRCTRSTQKVTVAESDH